MGVAAGLAWTACLFLAVWSADVPAGRGLGALIVGAVLLLPHVEERLRIGLGVVAAMPLLVPALLPDRPDEGSLAVPVLLSLATLGALLSPHLRWRVGVSALLLGVGVLGAAKQIVVPVGSELAPAILALGVGVAQAALAAPGARWSGLPLVGVGALVIALAPAESNGRAARQSAPADARAMLDAVRRAPHRAEPGVSYAARYGARSPVAVGWNPHEAVPAEVAVDAAWELERQGQLGRAVTLLQRQPKPRPAAVRFAIAAMLAEAGEASDPPSVEVPGVQQAPGVVLEDVDFRHGGGVRIPVQVRSPVSEVVLRARGEAYQGAPQLRVRLARNQIVWAVDGPQERVWARAIEPGAWVLVVAYDNDFADDGGDRNLLDVSVELR